MILREEADGDCAAIFDVHVAAFPTDAEARLVDRLRTEGDLTISLIVEHDGAIVGHLALSRMAATSGDAPIDALGLAPVAVLPDHHRQGMAAALIQEGIVRAGAQGVAAVFVLGDPAYYARFGFTAEAARPFANPYAGPYFQAILLDTSRDLSQSGKADYARAFDDLGAE